MATVLSDRNGNDATPDVKGAMVVTTNSISGTNKPSLRSQLNVHESLENRQSLVSGNQRFTFSNQEDGNFVLYDKGNNNRILWASNTPNRATGKLTMQADGNLVGVVWSTKTGGGSNTGGVFVMQDDGNAVIRVDGKKIWQTGTKQIPRANEKEPFESGDSLIGGQALLSPNGRFRFLLQRDCGLRLYDTSTNNSILWMINSNGRDREQTTLVLGTDGDLAVFEGPARYWSSRSRGKGDISSVLTVQDDGNVVIRSKGTIIWSTDTKVTVPANLDRLMADENLRPGQFLLSPNGTYKLMMQNDCNLVLLDTKYNNRVIWNAGSQAQQGAFRAELRADGEFAVYSNDYRLWSTSTFREPDETSVLILRNDGEIVILSQGVQFWALGTKQKTDNFDRMFTGENLWSGQSIKSPNGRYMFIVQDNGGLVLYDLGNNNRSLWDSGSKAPGGSKLSLQTDGNLVLYSLRGDARWASGTNGKGDESSMLKIQDDGNVVLTSKNGKMWTTNTRVKTDCLNSGETLYVGESLTSNNKQFKMIVQDDGKLIVYDISQEPRSVWAAGGAAGGDAGTTSARATLQDDGNLVVYAYGRVNWLSDTTGSNLVLTMQDDGNAVLSSGDVYVWSTNFGTRSPVVADRITTNQALRQEEFLISPNERYKLIMEDDGKFVLYKDGKATWSIENDHDDASSASRIVLRDDDNLVLEDPVGRSGWSSGTRRRSGGGNSALIIQDDGNIVLKSDGYILWSNDTNLVNAPDPVLSPVASGVSQLKRGECLAVNQYLTSPNGQYTAKVQPDGNFALRHKTSDAVLWTSNTAPNTAVSKLVLQWDCNLHMIGANNSVIWATDTSDINGDAVLKLQDDGNLVLSGQEMKWSTGTQFPALNGTIKELKTGESILQTQSLISSNGQYKLTFSEAGTICVSQDNKSTYYNIVVGKSDAKYLTCTWSYHNGVRRPTIRIRNSKGERLYLARTNESKQGNADRVAERLAMSNRQRYQRPTYDEPRFTLGDDGNAYIWFENDKIWQLSDQPRGSDPSIPQ